MHFDRFTAQLRVDEGKFRIIDGTMITPSTKYAWQGAVGADRMVDARMSSADDSITIGGTLLEPHSAGSSPKATQTAAEVKQ